LGRIDYVISNDSVLLVCPLLFVTDISTLPGVAVAAIRNVAVVFVLELSFRAVMEILLGTFTITPVRLVPVMLTGTDSPRAPEAGARC
jgi:hypothetical protein